MAEKTSTLRRYLRLYALNLYSSSLVTGLEAEGDRDRNSTAGKSMNWVSSPPWLPDSNYGTPILLGGVNSEGSFRGKAKGTWNRPVSFIWCQRRDVMTLHVQIHSHIHVFTAQCLIQSRITITFNNFRPRCAKKRMLTFLSSVRDFVWFYWHLTRTEILW
jgi:hypothetical protein